MRPTKVHPRIIQHPFADLLQGARLDSFKSTGQEIILNIQGVQKISSQVFEHQGRLFEKAVCNHVPLELRFSGGTKLNRSKFFTELESYPLDEQSRIIMSMYSWQQPGRREVFYLFFLRGPVGAEMSFFAKWVAHKISDHRSPFTSEQDWSPSPSMPGRLVPQPRHLHQRFGGDPVTIKLNGKFRHRRLFIGGTEIQPTHRPQVHAVVNLGETPSRWLEGNDIHPNDRVSNKGEGSQGMSTSEILEEANWIIDHLKKDRRVLLHCAAGMNRSVTIGCAVLMLLEGLNAEAALARIREQHPWAKPDSHHWLALRWLEINKKE